MPQPGWAAGVVRWVRRPGALQEWLVVGAVLFVLQVLLFSEYYSGATTAPWDFLGAYNAEAFAWWRDGSFFQPTQWMPYQWGGYPAAASLQNSGWYLPVGVVAWLVPFTIHAASALQAFHVAWGALGMYWLARRWGQGRAPALFGLVAYSFAVGFFSNAQHVDIVRAFAWVPWLLLCTSPQWPWRRVWGIPLAALVFWQAAISSYPGVLVLLAYGIVVWIVVAQVTVRPRFRDYLGPMLVTGLSAVLLSMVKFLPALLTRGIGGTTGASADVFDLGVLGTVFFQYDLDFLPNDLSMRSLFVVAPVLPLMVVARWRNPLVRVGAAVLGVGVLLGMPWPWSSLVERLPGLDLSRFQMADSRAMIGAGAILVAVGGLNGLLDHSSARSLPLRPDTVPEGPGIAGARRSPRYVLVAAIPCAALLIALAARFPTIAWMVPWSLVVLSCFTVVLLTWSTRQILDLGGQRIIAGLGVILILLATTSGLHWAHANTRPWSVPRVMAETGTWGQTSGQLIVHRADLEGLEQRPARTSLPADAVPGEERLQAWSGSYFSGIASIGGNANLVGAPAFSAIHASVVPESAMRTDALAFWSAPGVVMEAGESGLPTSDEVSSCLAGSGCGEHLDSKPVAYALDSWAYHVATVEDVTIIFNEAYYPGFRLSACMTFPTGDCTDLPVEMAPSGAASSALEAGEWDLVLTYETPGQRAGWIAFWSGTSMVGLSGLIMGFARHREKRVHHSTDH